MLARIGVVGQAEREAALECRRERIAKAKREGRYEGSVPTARRQRSSVRGPLAARPRESRSGLISVGPASIGSCASRCYWSAAVTEERQQISLLP